MRLIDADAFLEKMMQTSRYFDVKFDIAQMPTIDAVPVVRCNDCKHFKHDETNDEWYCKKSGADIEYVDSLTHFCSYGERKEGAE